MVINVPQSVFDKYFEVIDSTFTIFGVTCQLVYIEKILKLDDDFDNIPSVNTINVHRIIDVDHNIGGDTYIEVEKLEDIKLKVYWDRKSWVKVTQDIAVPDNAIQTIFFASDLPRILRAKELIVHKDIKDLSEMRFKRSGESYPLGLQQKKYFGCFWERT